MTKAKIPAATVEGFKVPKDWTVRFISDTEGYLCFHEDGRTFKATELDASHFA